MKSRPIAPWFVAVVAAASAGCHRRVPTLDVPPFETVDAFPEAPAAEKAAAKGTPAPPMQTVQFGQVVASVPLQGQDWLAASDEYSTLVAHRVDTAPVDAWIYAEHFSRAAETSPSFELARWYATVAPPLLGLQGVTEAVRARLGIPGGAASAETAASSSEDPAAPIAPTSGGPEGEVEGEVAPPAPTTPDAPPPPKAAAPEWTPAALVRTLGDGVGFDPRVDTYTGWRWMGSLDSRLQLRLSRVDGIARLGEHTRGNGALDSALAMLGERSPEVAERLAAERSSKGPTERSSAFMIVGVLTGQEREGTGSGELLAVVCKRPCTQTRTLASILASFRHAKPNEPVSNPFKPDELAASIGLRLASAELFGTLAP